MKNVFFMVKILIMACLLVAGIVVFSGSSGESFLFLDPLRLIVVLVGGAALTLMGFSFPEIAAAFKHAWGASVVPDKKALERSRYFWEAAARNFFQVGVLIAVTGFAIMFKCLPGGLQQFWKNVGLGFIATLYGLILAALCAIAGLRVSNKLPGPGQSQQEIQGEFIPPVHKVNMEKIIGALLFIGILGWVILKADALVIFIHWPSLLVVAGGAIFFVLCVGNGVDGLSTTLGFTFAGVIGLLYGLVQMFTSPGISGVAAGMTFAILACVFALVGMLLGGVHRQDHVFKTGNTDKKIAISRLAWYGLPVVVLLFLLFSFLLTLIPVVKKAH